MVNFLRIYFQNSPVSLNHIPRMLGFIIIKAILSPMAVIEKFLYEKKIQAHEIKSPPIFIIGHWRSGTTLLHQLLISDKNKVYINFYQAVFPQLFLTTEKFLKPALQKIVHLLKMNIPYFNNISFNWNFPCEEETALLNMDSLYSSYWGYVYPENAITWFDKHLFSRDISGAIKEGWKKDYLFLIKKISYFNKGKQLILKSPSNTARIEQLLEQFPDARFIYIFRDACDVYYSHCKLWQQNIKNFSLQKVDIRRADKIVLTTYEKMMHLYQNTKVKIPETRLFELSYEELLNNPIQKIKEIYQFLEIQGFEEFEADFLKSIEKIKKYQTYSYEKDQSKCDEINKIMTGSNV